MKDWSQTVHRARLLIGNVELHEAFVCWSGTKSDYKIWSTINISRRIEKWLETQFHWPCLVWFVWQILFESNAEYVYVFLTRAWRVAWCLMPFWNLTWRFILQKHLQYEYSRNRHDEQMPNINFVVMRISYKLQLWKGLNFHFVLK